MAIKQKLIDDFADWFADVLITDARQTFTNRRKGNATTNELRLGEKKAVRADMAQTGIKENNLQISPVS